MTSPDNKMDSLMLSRCVSPELVPRLGLFVALVPLGFDKVDVLDWVEHGLLLGSNSLLGHRSDLETAPAAHPTLLPTNNRPEHEASDTPIGRTRRILVVQKHHRSHNKHRGEPSNPCVSKARN